MLLRPFVSKFVISTVSFLFFYFKKLSCNFMDALFFLQRQGVLKILSIVDFFENLSSTFCIIFVASDFFYSVCLFVLDFFFSKMSGDLCPHLRVRL